MSSPQVVISIPIILLWRVKIALRKKLALGSILCLSVFLIIISIIKVAAANTIGSQVDTTWGVFWLQAEAAVAVIAVSITMFRSLFLADGSRNGQQHKPSFPQSPTSYKKLWTQRATPQANYPNMPSATFSFGTSTTPRAEAHGSEDIALPVEETDILVTRHFSTQVVREPKNVSFKFVSGFERLTRLTHLRHTRKRIIPYRTNHSCELWLQAMIRERKS